MSNKIYLVFLSLLVLSACGDNNSNTNQSTSKNANQAQNTMAKTLTQEQLFLKVQLKQKESVKEIQNYLEELKKTVDSEEKAKEARGKAEEKFNAVNKDNEDYFKKLQITDSDILGFLKLQDDTLQYGKEQEIESDRLVKLSDNGKKKLDKKETDKYTEISKKLWDANREITVKKIILDEKFAKSALGPLKEFYMISDIMNLEYKESDKIAKKLSEDKTIKSREVFNVKFINEIQKVDQVIINQLNELDIKDEQIKKYRDLVAVMMQKKINVSAKAPEMEKQYAKNKKLSDSNAALFDELNQSSKDAEAQLEVVLKYLAK